MRAAVRKLRVEDVEKLQALVIENFDAIEPGLTVLDARLLLGHATIDVIGVDSVGALVLGNVGFSANEDMLLKAVEAYSWCLEYPEALVRLYPSCQLSEDRPPRLLFVVERMPDAFHRKIKQLGFPEVDCVEFRHLEFDSVPAVYFESLLRLRRGVAPPATMSPSGAPGAIENLITMGGGAVRASGARPRVGQASAEASAATPPAADRLLSSREPAGVVSMVSRQAAAPAPRVERPRAAAPVVLHEPQPLIVEADVDTLAAPELVPVATLPEVVATPEPHIEPEPVAPPQIPAVSEPPLRPAAMHTVPSMVPTHVPVAAQDPERVSFKDLADSLLGAMTATQEALAHTAGDAGAKAVIPVAPVASEPIVMPPALDLGLEPGKVVEPVAEPQPVVTPAGIEPVVEPATTPAMPQGFEGLKFPNDGVLTRQWMEFLSQMSTTK